MMHYRLLFIILLCTQITLAQDDTCQTSHMQVGDYGYVTSVTPINLRETPNGTRVGQLEQWDTFRVSAGSECVANYRWWEIEADGQTGWVAEGIDDTYWLQPVDFTGDDVITSENFNFLSLLTEYQGEGNVSSSFAISDNWIALSSGIPDYRVYVWDRLNAEQQIIIAPEMTQNAYIRHIAITENILAISVASDERIEYWDLSTEERLGQIEDFVYDMDFADETLIYIGLGEIYFYDFMDNVLTIDTGTKTGQKLAISPDQRFIAAIYLDRSMDVFTREGDFVATFEESGSGIFDVTFSQDNQHLIYTYCREPIEAAGQECIHHKIVFWNIESGEVLNTLDYLNLEGGTSHIELAVSPDNTLLIVHAGVQLLGIDVDTGEIIGRIPDVLGADLMFSVDGQQLIQRSDDPSIEVWGFLTD